MENNIDLNLDLDIDRYLLNYDAFQVIKELNSAYIEKNPQIYNYRELNFQSIYPILYDFLSCINLKKELDIEELFFISYIAYKLKGATESVSLILNLINCESTIKIYYDPDDPDEKKDRILDLKIEYIETTNPYLAQRNLIRLCKDLLFFTKYKIKIEKISTIYEITGEVNKTYFTVSSYYVGSDTVIDTQTIEW